MYILIREGSDAQNFEALHPLIREAPSQLMFCSDDLRPDDLLKGHINTLVQRALDHGHNLFDVLRIASLNPARHYRIPIGLLQPGDYADFISTPSLRHLHITQVFHHGTPLQNNYTPPPSRHAQAIPATAGLPPHTVTPASLRLPLPDNAILRVITTSHGTLLTGEEHLPPSLLNGCAVTDTARDLVKLVVLNRHHPSLPPAIAFLKGTHLRAGALAQSISHDNHHLIACGVTDEAIADALNAVIQHRGGISLAYPSPSVTPSPPPTSVTPPSHETLTLQLPIGGLISPHSLPHVAHELSLIQRRLNDLRPPDAPPFPPLSFLSLIVIPSLKLSHKGLYHTPSASFLPPFFLPSPPSSKITSPPPALLSSPLSPPPPVIPAKAGTCQSPHAPSSSIIN